MRCLIAALALLAATTSTHAALVRIDFEGTNSSPAAANVFGTAVPTIQGYLVYDDATPATLFSTFNGVTNNFNGAIKALGFDMGGVFSGERNAAFGSAQVRDGAGALADRLSFNNMLIGAADVIGEPTGFLSAQFTLGLASTGPALSDANLPGLFDPAIFDGQRNIQVFISRAPGSTPTGVAVSFNYNLSNLRVSSAEVPLPGSLALMGSEWPGWSRPGVVSTDSAWSTGRSRRTSKPLHPVLSRISTMFLPASRPDRKSSFNFLSSAS